MKPAQSQILRLTLNFWFSTITDSTSSSTAQKLLRLNWGRKSEIRITSSALTALVSPGFYNFYSVYLLQGWFWSLCFSELVSSTKASTESRIFLVGFLNKTFCCWVLDSISGSLRWGWASLQVSMRSSLGIVSESSRSSIVILICYFIFCNSKNLQ